MNLKQPTARWIEVGATFVTLAILLLYTYVDFVVVPYLGIDFNSDGGINAIYVDQVHRPFLEKGVKILRVNGMEWSAFQNDTRQLLLKDHASGQVVSLTVMMKNGSVITVPWVIPEPQTREIVDRLVNLWVLSFLFWIVGVMTVLVVRPRNALYWLLLVFFYVTAIWFAAGNTSRWHYWQSAVVVRSVTWLLVPVYFHLHWALPKQRYNGSIPLWFITVYTFGVSLALLEWVQLLPQDLFYIGFLIAVIGSIGFMVGYYFKRPLMRPQILVLTGLLIAAFLPPTLFSISGIIGTYPWYAGIAMLSVPIIPFAYFYTAFRHQLGISELRVNRLLITYTYLLLVIFISASILSILGLRFRLSAMSIFVAGLTATIVVVIAVPNYERYAKWLERRLFNITIDPEVMLATFATRIPRSLEQSSLVQLLQNELLPSLFVRQSVLLKLEDDGSYAPIYIQDVPVSQLPKPVQIPRLLEIAGTYHSPGTVTNLSVSLSWVRLTLPLKVGNDRIGIWLFGRRDPDDYYATAELPTFQALAGYTAIALVKIDQTEKLRSLLQSNIDQRETEQTRLSQMLHDEILNELSQLRSLVLDAENFRQFDRQLADISSAIREMSWSLRPNVLNQGLAIALADLCDSLSIRVGDTPVISENVTQHEPVGYPDVEEHVYEIAKQACENSIRHANGTFLFIHGHAGPNAISIVIADDGVGFEIDSDLGLESLLARRHFGLLGMHERAEIIGARLTVHSDINQGTSVIIEWAQKQSTVPE